MEEIYINEDLLKEKNQLEIEKDLIKNIVKTSEDLKKDNKNFEMAEQGLVDYYIYHIKANQAKLDYLIKTAKSIGITMEIIDEFRNDILKEDIV